MLVLDPQLFKRFDVDGSGAVDFEEFLAMLVRLVVVVVVLLHCIGS